MIAVMGAAGNTGRIVAERLLEQGERVRAIGRSKERLAPLVAKGAEAAVGDANDASFLARAFAGADAAYTLIPPNLQVPDFRAYQDHLGEATVRGLREAGVKHVVFLSSVGGDRPSGTGPIAGLHAQEERLRGLRTANVLLLRPAYFFENHFATLGLIKNQGINGGALAGNLQMPMIATRDIGDAAARAVRTRDFKAVVVRELLGPRDLTMDEATRIIGQGIGKPDLKYVQFPYDAFAESLVQAGLSRDLAGLYAEMCKGFNDGHARSVEGRRPQNTTPTRLEDFAPALAQAYRSL
jgi:uncharacterized protein YbjT (DUF2867 family)